MPEGHEGGTPHNPSWLNIALRPFFENDPHKIPPYVEAVAASVLTAVVIGVVAATLTRKEKLSVRSPSRGQAALEWVVTWLDSVVTDLIGDQGRNYLPLVGTLFLYIFFMNLSGLIPGWISPTSSASVTAGLAISVFLYVQYEGIRTNGLGGYLKHFAGEPIWLAPLNFPIHIIGELARPVSLTLRLFGNIFGEDLAILILMGLGLAFYPIQFVVTGLAVFTSFVQALVFSMLTCVYIAGATVHEGPHHEPDEHHGVMEVIPPRPPV
jgi:F-type H+-transporting ATPase subunit a